MVGEYGDNKVQLFIRSGSTWSYGQLLKIPNASGDFGHSVSFSADGASLAVGEHTGTNNNIALAGNVYLFSKSGKNWKYSRTLSAKVPSANKYFGYTVKFSSVGNDLAIFELYGKANTTFNAGVVSIIDISK